MSSNAEYSISCTLSELSQGIKIKIIIDKSSFMKIINIIKFIGVMTSYTSIISYEFNNKIYK